MHENRIYDNCEYCFYNNRDKIMRCNKYTFINLSKKEKIEFKKFLNYKIEDCPIYLLD